jgi:hypothetical protein
MNHCPVLLHPLYSQGEAELGESPLQRRAGEARSPWLMAKFFTAYRQNPLSMCRAFLMNQHTDLHLFLEINHNYL